MKRAAVLVDHGSREESANQQLERLAERVRAQLPDWQVAAAHMELAAPTLAEAIAACVAAGCREIVVHPCFLAPGRHVREDIPRQLAEAGGQHPGVALRLSEPLGLHDGVVAAVVDRIQAAPAAR